MSFGELPTHELAEAAYHEAENFAIDPAQLEGREKIEAFAVRSSEWLDQGMAISACEENGVSELRVSLADVGTFIHPESAVHYLAKRSVSSFYRDGHVQIPMLPPALSEEKLSFLSGCERPAITLHLPIDAQGTVGDPRFTKNIVTATFLTPDQLEGRFFDEHGEGQATQLDAIARRLFANRTEDPDAMLVVENEMGDALGLAETAVGAFILQESKFAVNAAIAGYLYRNNLPGIFRVQGHAFDEEGPYIDHLAPASYSAHPKEHFALGFSRYAHANRPLSRFSDLILLTILAANLGGEESPYSDEDIAYAVKRLNTTEAKKGRSLFDDPPLAGTHRPVTTSTPKPARAPRTKALLGRLQDGSAHPGDISTALLGEVRGGPEVVQNLRRVAAEFMSTHIGMARSVIQIGVDKGWLKRQADSDTTLTIIDGNGNTYPYTIRHKKIADALTYTRLLSSISGQEIQPVVPTFDEWIKENPVPHFKSLEKQSDGGISLKYHVLANKDGTMTISARLKIFDETYDCLRVVSSGSKAEKDVFFHDLILGFGLKHMPKQPIVPKVVEQKKQEPRETPVMNLAVHSERRGVTLPTYRFPYGKEKPTPESTFFCQVTFTDSEGNEQLAGAYGLNTQAAKEAAASVALSHLPPVPPKQKKKKQ